MEKNNRKDKNQNIQVFVRLRPLNQRERDIKSLGVIDVVNNREVIVRHSQQTLLTKKFTYDKAFGPNAKQVEVYQEVVHPLIKEVLAGYNCTVFAYGQTGTGKTHTMVGEPTGGDTTWQTDIHAGIIPRALSQLFDELRLTKTDHTVRVSYLELYNEELFDLLSSTEDNSKLRIYEDVTRKGSNIVNGLEEITVSSKSEVYNIMAKGQERRKIASTLMNAQSSRSHTVFSIVLHMKENSPEGEELVKIGKLNLVDLAGSENISKAGSDNPAKKERARECVNINQSLLTLGRVITALVERQPHIPYRESKLTRILQESLGGRTKTSIIATISPGHKDIEETMSTLEYAYRAKNIQNKPEVNQKMTKKAILKEYAEEIDKLKRDLQAARDKTGVYLTNETFAEMTFKDEEQKKEIQELLLRKRAMEEERERMEVVFGELNRTLEEKDSKLNQTKTQLEMTKEKLINTKNILVSSQQQQREQAQQIAARRAAAGALAAAAAVVLRAADEATAHVHLLHDANHRRSTVESCNLQVTAEYREASASGRARLRASAAALGAALRDSTAADLLAIEKDVSESVAGHEQNMRAVEVLSQQVVDAVNEVETLCCVRAGAVEAACAAQAAAGRAGAAARGGAARAALAAARAVAGDALCRVRALRDRDALRNHLEQWYSGASGRVGSLRTGAVAMQQRAAGSLRGRACDARALRAQLRERLASCNHAIHTTIQKKKEEKQMIEERLLKQRTDIEVEITEANIRLNNWAEEERRLLEERISRHLAVEKQVLEEKLQQKMLYIEEEKRQFNERMQSDIELHEKKIQENNQELNLVEDYLQKLEAEDANDMTLLNKYFEEFDIGSTAINVDMEVLTQNVTEVYEQLQEETLTVLQETCDGVQEQLSTAVSADEQAEREFVEVADNMITNVVNINKDTLDLVVQNLKKTSSSAVEQLASVLVRTASLAERTSGLAARSGEALRRADDEAGRLADAVIQFADALDQLDNQLLDHKYQRYIPTGGTPARREYQYPRALSPASPLAPPAPRAPPAPPRPLPLHPEECIEIESDTEPDADANGDREEESVEKTVQHAPHPGLILKSTSDTDIYIRIEQSKENQKEASSMKKPSRLPAPSGKKPLIERNGTV